MSIYLDNASTTRACPEAIEAVTRALAKDYGNPSSGHTPGREAKKLVDYSRGIIAGALDAMPGEIFFTAGGTEADNWAVLSSARKMKRRGRHIVSTAVEHDAVRKSLEVLADEGFEVELLKPEKDGSIPLDRFERAIRDDTVLVSVMMVCNETGNIYPISQISKIIKRKKSPALLHTDAVQGFLKLPFSAPSLGADMISLSAHKLHGPKGIGALYIRKGLNLPPLIYGGGQEGGSRSGTEAVPQIFAFGEAVRVGLAAFAGDTEHMAGLKKLLIEMLKEEIPEAIILGRAEAPHIVSVSMPGYRSEVIVNYMDGKGIYISKGSACKRGRRSHVLEAMNLDTGIIDSSFRVSFSRENTEADVRDFISALKSAKEELFTELR